MFKKKKVEEQKVGIRTSSNGCVRFVDVHTLANMYNTLIFEIEELQSQSIILATEVKKLKEENAKLKAKNEQIGNISLNIGTMAEDVAKQICNNILKDKENKTLADDLRAINKDLLAKKYGQSFIRAKYWLVKLENLYPDNNFTIYYYGDKYVQIKAVKNEK